jgi:uncharacterized protein YaaN involved in tellurite resistance
MGDNPSTPDSTANPTNPVNPANPPNPVNLANPANLANPDVNAEALAVIDHVKTSMASPLAAVEVDKIGRNEQRDLADAIDVLATKAVDLRALKGEQGSVAKTLTDFRQKMDQLNPHIVQQSTVARIVSKVPIAGPMVVDAWTNSRLHEIGTRYQSLRDQVDAVMRSLYANKDVILQDNISLSTLYERVQRAHQGVLHSIQLGEQVKVKLVAMRDGTANASEKETYDLLINRVNVRIQDLRTMEQVDLQEAVSMNITVTNNMDLADAIERTVTVVRPLMVVGLAIQAALANQKRAIEAVKSTQDYAGQLLVANADAIQRQTQEIGDLTQNASVALTKVEEAYTKVLSAIDQADAVRRKGSEAAEAASAKLQQMSATLQPKVEKLETGRKARLEV